jgi:hypothetical protein
MMSLRRFLWLIVACLVLASAYVAWLRRRTEDARAGEPEWPPFDLAPEAASTAPPTASVAPAPWAAPVDGSCPDGYPVKAKESSRIYHVPGGRFYERTVPDRCYADPDSAEIDGYRASKS